VRRVGGGIIIGIRIERRKWWNLKSQMYNSEDGEFRGTCAGILGALKIGVRGGRRGLRGGESRLRLLVL
jgi:hypothetical protein